MCRRSYGLQCGLQSASALFTRTPTIAIAYKVACETMKNSHLLLLFCLYTKKQVQKETIKKKKHSLKGGIFYTLMLYAIADTDRCSLHLMLENITVISKE